MADREEHQAEIVVVGTGSDRRWVVLTAHSERTFSSLYNAQVGLARVMRGGPLGKNHDRGRVAGSQNTRTARPLSRLAQHLLQYADRHDLSVAELATLFGVSEYTMRAWILGNHRMSPLVAWRIHCLQEHAEKDNSMPTPAEEDFDE